MSVPLDTELGAPPWIADTEPDPHPPDMDSVRAPVCETGSMPRAVERGPLSLADVHGWHAPVARVPDRRVKLERSLVAPAVKAKGPLAVSWRAVTAFSLGAAVTALASAALESGMTRLLAVSSVLVGALWCLVCIERR